MFRVKVCGITRPEDAASAAEAGADAIGLNFYPKSPRCVGDEAARTIAAEAAGRLLRVGVLVNATAEEIDRVVTTTPLDAIQLHGDEPVGFVAELPVGVPVIRAVRMGAAGLDQAVEAADGAAALARPLAGVLTDAAGRRGEYGGTGEAADWPRFARERARLGETPALLAGGLTAENVAEAIGVARPDGVDTASGVESAPGLKDAEKTRRFVAAALTALASL